MTGDDLTRLLTVAAEAAEPHAPVLDPVAVLARERRRRDQRRGHLVALSFVLFVLVLQAATPDAAGATRPASPRAVVAAADPHLPLNAVAAGGSVRDG